MNNLLLIATLFAAIFNICNGHKMPIGLETIGIEEIQLESKIPGVGLFATAGTFNFILEAEDGSSTSAKMITRIFDSASNEIYSDSRVVETGVKISSRKPKSTTRIGGINEISLTFEPTEPGLYTMVYPEVIVKFTPFPVISALNPQEENIVARKIAINGILTESTTDEN